MGKSIKIKTHPQIQLAVNISDEMIKDYKECGELSNGDGKDCDKCSWNELVIGELCMCQLEEMDKLLKK